MVHQWPRFQPQEKYFMNGAYHSALYQDLHTKRPGLSFFLSVLLDRSHDDEGPNIGETD